MGRRRYTTPLPAARGHIRQSPAYVLCREMNLSLSCGCTRDFQRFSYMYYNTVVPRSQLGAPKCF